MFQTGNLSKHKIYLVGFEVETPSRKWTRLPLRHENISLLTNAAAVGSGNSSPQKPRQTEKWASESGVVPILFATDLHSELLED